MSTLARTLPASSTKRTILHVDLDCFFVSVERVLNPSLASRPVIVGGSAESRGVVCSASREARALGVHAGMATGVAQRLCPDAVLLPGRGRLYARAATAAQRLLREFAPVVERASIDEAYLDVTDGMAGGGDALGLGAAIQRALGDRLGLPSSVGIGSNKLVAKVACQRAKPEGLIEVWPGYEQAFLAPLPVADLPGVGPVLAERLRLFGLTTVGELARVDAALMETMFGAWGRELARAARGIGQDELDEDETPRSLGAERTFPRDLAAPSTLIAELYDLGEKVAARLHAAGMRGRTVTLKVRTADFKTVTRSRTLGAPTDHASEIAGTACFLLRETHRGQPVRLLGISVTGLTDEPVQAALLPDPAAPLVPAEVAPGRKSMPRPRLVIKWHR
jgi:DNA polymerase IV